MMSVLFFDTIRGHAEGLTYILVEMGDYFKTVTKPRIQKAVYSQEWKDGKPVDRNGVSQCFKYIRLEQYEDTLNNLKVEKPDNQELFDNKEFSEDYMLNYMIDVETRGSLLNIEQFDTPFSMTIKTTRDNELEDTKVDLVDTFNYLIGMEVDNIRWHKDGNICLIEGNTHKDGKRTLIIWRNIKEVDNEMLNQFFDKQSINTMDREFDVVYVNGDNTLQNLKSDEEHWKVRLIEEEFMNCMFNER